MIQVPFHSLKRYIQCPACGEGEYGVSHLGPGTQTAWHCEECGVKFSLHVISEDQVQTVPSLTERKVKTLVTLRSKGPVTLIIEGTRLEDNSKAEDGTGSDEYYYNEHTCPTNYMSDVVRVIDADGDEDPHGIFAWVKTEPWRDLEKE